MITTTFQQFHAQFSSGKGPTPHVAIVGAGPGGLACAMLLASSGMQVTIYEAHEMVGGRTAHVVAKGASGEYRFDKGPTFFMMPYVLDEVFAACGEKLQDHVELTRLDPMYRLLLGRPNQKPLQLDATQNVKAMCDRIAAVNPRDGARFAQFLEDNRAKLRHSESILRNAMRTPFDLFGSDVWKDTLKVGPMLSPHLSVHQLLEKYFEDPLVRLAVCFQSKYLGMSPYECPSLFTILPFIEYEYGIWHPKGGCHALMQAMAKVARSLGVEIVCNAPVSQVLTQDDGFGHRNDGGELPHAQAVVIGGKGELAGQTRVHDAVVINADATWALKNLFSPRVVDRSGGIMNRYDADKLDNKRYSCSTYMLYLGVKGDVGQHELPHHTIYVSERYKQNLEEISQLGTLSADPSIYLCNPSRLDKTLAPQGCSSLYVLIPTPNCDAKIDWASANRQYRKDAFEQLRKYFGLTLHDERDPRIECVTEYTPDTWKHANINKGATFNLAHNLAQMLHLRPQNKLQGFDNVYLVGGGTHPGSGLPTIFLSAQISAGLLCQQFGFTPTTKQQHVRDIGQSRVMR
jgi:phytoene desaturase